MLPFFVTLPLVAVEVIRRGGGAAHRALNAIALPAIGILAAVQVVAWAQNSRRYAVGNNGPGLFALHARWSPAGGWWLWLVVIALAAAALIAVGTFSTPAEVPRRNEAKPIRRRAEPGAGAACRGRRIRR